MQKSNNNIIDDTYTIEFKKDPTKLCSCKCHFGGAVSCPDCKENHGEVCCHCKD